MIKNIVYLDEFKMYSLSAQLFEGVTESHIKSSVTETEDTEHQKGPFFSGKVLADIVKETSGTTEQKYLHDYSYTTLEKHLLDTQKVLVVDPSSPITAEDTKEFPFIKVKGKAIFNDIALIRKTLSEFNEIGESIAYSSCHALIEEINNRPPTKPNKTKKAVQAQKESEIKALLQFAIESQNLRIDKDIVKHLGRLLQFGYKDQFEIQLEINNSTYSSSLTRDYLREPEHQLIYKYARKTEKEFVIFGYVTQANDREKTSLESPPPLDGGGSIKKAMRHITATMAPIESLFAGKLPGEIIIDPIAVYTEL